MPSPGPDSAELSDPVVVGAITESDKSAYARAGVDIEAGDRAVALMEKWIAKTRRPEVLGGLGGFAGLFDAAPLARMAHPVLATSTDGVGTKVAIAQAMDVHHTIGLDLVAMVVDDLVVCGAEPLFMTDYIATGRVVPERIAAIVQGIAEGCVLAGCALVGGETAEHPGLLAPEEYDLAGAATGVVERDAILGPERVRPGDVAIALAASGLHSNGYALARQVFLTEAGWSLDRDVAEFGRTLGEELLAPTRIYSRDCLALIEAAEVHAVSHITGGGLANNLARVVPDGVQVRIDRGSWTPPAVFELLAAVGALSQPDLEATVNMGVGMIALVTPEAVPAALRLLAERNVPAWVCGEACIDAPGAVERVRLDGRHPGH